MSKKVRRLGLIVIALTLLVGCNSANPNSNSMEDTSAVEESNTTEALNSSEEINTVEKTNSLEESYELKRSIYDVEVTQDYGIFQVNNTTPYQELITKTVDIHQFAQYFDHSGGRGIDEVMEFIGVECLRETEAGALYSVHKVEQGGLLYIFYYNHDWEPEIRTNGIRGWFYVRERLSISDFGSLQENVSTIEDVIEINEVEQIFLNCYQADPMSCGLGTDLYTYHYLEDGIYAMRYDLIDEKLVLTDHILVEDFDIPFTRESQYSPYYARILEMDWVE